MRKKVRKDLSLCNSYLNDEDEKIKFEYDQLKKKRESIGRRTEIRNAMVYLAKCQPEKYKLRYKTNDSGKSYLELADTLSHCSGSCSLVPRWYIEGSLFNGYGIRTVEC